MLFLTAFCDLAGVWPVMTVTRHLSQAADAAVTAAVGFLFRQAGKAGDWLAEDPAGYIVLGMGKYGAFELNYSSDIDLIIFYDTARVRLRTGLEAQPFFVRITRDLVRLLAERTGEGYVFRTDLEAQARPRRHAARNLDQLGARLLRERRPELGARRPHQGAARRRRPCRGPLPSWPTSRPISGASTWTSRRLPTSTP